MQPYQSYIHILAYSFLSQRNLPKREKKGSSNTSARARLLRLCGTSNVIAGLKLTVTVFLSRSFQQGVFSSVMQHGL
jgi:hypothetical protein